MIREAMPPASANAGSAAGVGLQLIGAQPDIGNGLAKAQLGVVALDSQHLTGAFQQIGRGSPALALASRLSR